ncbi:sure-like protein [Trametopsis cervina]|nr:sure-like protein [Trametopsis cervina]
MISLPFIVTFAALLIPVYGQTKIVLSNDDGWAVAQIRAERDTLKAAGFDVILSSPAQGKSGSGSSSTTPTTLDEPCEFDSCTAGSPPTGFNASDTRLNYVNAFPVDAARFGIQTLAPQFFNSPPDLVVTGPNVGSNLGVQVFFSGTVGAASEAAKEGISAIAFSGQSTAQESFTALESSPNSPSVTAALLYSQLTVKFLNTILASSARPIVPAKTVVNVNFSPTTDNCTRVEDFDWVFSRSLPDPLHLETDVETCGTTHLPTESTVVGRSGCHASVSVISATSKFGVGASEQGAVLNRISTILSCLQT